jgi:hypothetical protein
LKAAFRDLNIKVLRQSSVLRIDFVAKPIVVAAQHNLDYELGNRCLFGQWFVEFALLQRAHAYPITAPCGGEIRAYEC